MKARLRGRLFWKILFGFWLTFIMVSQLLWLGFQFYGRNHEPPEHKVARRIVDIQMASAVSVLQRGGLAALNDMMADWQPDDKRFFSVMQVDNLPQETPQPSVMSFDRAATLPDEVVEWVTVADGTHYRLRYDVKGLRNDNDINGGPHPHILNIPMPMFFIAGVGGLLFSLILAWNLTRPMRQLSQGFSRISAGDLEVRLYPDMRGRHDELSVVAKDFDAMVERLSALINSREALLHDISHELRSPLARLQLATGLARQLPDNVEGSLDRIDEEARRLDKMIGEILTLSRAGYDSQPEERYFDLLGLVEAVTDDVRYEAQVPGVEIVLTCDQPADYTVRGNAELIRRAVENVLRNALRFSQQGEQVDVSLRHDTDWLVISVRDRGPGVDSDKLSSIFDPFVRVNSPLMGKGYGLGLSIVRKIVLAHHGEVQAINHKQGGLVLIIRLPHWTASQ
ncbi:two-component sensor histidine kinase [Erwinia sp. OLTSP20]|uniref:ATP-binding protein n=1 Tax=unclassified Erwinia TaxID=2622719 RepID=UPI000C1A33A8|nr:MULTISPECIES: ATP-binding protein [unclassified Erwinia]PIJ51557.1 two-component sensor histidine kinase [Erwinia sp. OAMSP11]PIJ75857.1 two-component sensor histidine kinase [Erwinia sp. OLSSP12]PIJ83467.1 two-component sensor histidine kinase [Erwinia sp. OLCASP19]PIJ86300.1 two-component sensor histidine kinase [Erwinia sp. OLMTSP26]PIJ88457.1 two-component sensor histidine kinase [Erwinia sp. OLMDSP33]